MVPPGPSLSPLDEANLRVRVQAVVDSVLAEQGAILTAIGDDLVPLLDALRGLLQGGKRLRPAFAYWGWRGAGGDAKDPATDVIMVGPGTGVAPFRAFVQERRATEAPGRNWLFFGDRHFTHDFLYQLEWQEALEDGSLARIDVAFSRDQPEKVYVQDRIWEQRRELVSWLDGGAHFYVCGDAKRMAKDVERAIIDVAASHGGKSPEEAVAYLASLKKANRYQADVY